MEAATLDTSGRVECAASFQPLGWAIWSDLDPFTQGHIEALFDGVPDLSVWERGGHYRPVGFADLAPDALARLISDCAAIRSLTTPPPYPATFGAGLTFWWDREDSFSRSVWKYGRAKMRACAPPLAPYLADDGKVHLREAA